MEFNLQMLILVLDLAPFLPDFQSVPLLDS